MSSISLMARKKILLTGLTGHVGSRLVHLLHNDYEVHSLGRSKSHPTLVGVIHHKTDLTSNWSTKGLPTKIEAVIHLAQSRNYRDFPAQAIETFQVNAASTATLLDYAQRAGAKKFILASTGGLYQPCRGLIHTSSPINPTQGNLAHYFSTKQAAELLTYSYSAIMDVTVLRPFFIYGPGQSGEKLIARLIQSVKTGNSIQLMGNNGLRINPIHVDDVGEAIRVLISADGINALNLAGPDVVSIRTIAYEIGKKMRLDPVFESVDGLPGRIVADHSPLESLLGRPLIGFREGIATQLTQ